MPIQVQCAGGQSYGRKLGAHDQNSEERVLIEKRSSRLDSSGFAALLYECMYIVNSRPLTTQPLTTDTSAADPVLLTPNNFLTMKDTMVQPHLEISRTATCVVGAMETGPVSGRTVLEPMEGGVPTNASAKV